MVVLGIGTVVTGTVVTIVLDGDPLAGGVVVDGVTTVVVVTPLATTVVVVEVPFGATVVEVLGVYGGSTGIFGGKTIVVVVIEPLGLLTVVVVDCCAGRVVVVVALGVVVVVVVAIGLGAPIPAAPAPGLAPGAAGIYVVTVVGDDGNEVVVVPICIVVGVVEEVGGTLIGAVGMPVIKSSTMSI
jgi:hypothetical protein